MWPVRADQWNIRKIAEKTSGIKCAKGQRQDRELGDDQQIVRMLQPTEWTGLH